MNWSVATSSTLSTCASKSVQHTISHAVLCVASLELGLAVLLTIELPGLSRSYTRNAVEPACASSGAVPLSRNLKTERTELLARNMFR